MPRKYDPTIKVTRVYPAEDGARFIVWVRIGLLEIRDVLYNRNNGQVLWPRKGKYPVVVAMRGLSPRVRRRIEEYLTIDTDRAVNIEPQEITERLCDYCHEVLRPTDETRGNYHAAVCATEAERQLEHDAQELIAAFGPEKAEAWLVKKKLQRGLMAESEAAISTTT